MRLIRRRGFAVVAAVLAVGLGSAALPAGADPGQTKPTQTSTVRQGNDPGDPNSTSMRLTPGSAGEGPGTSAWARVRVDAAADVPPGLLALSVTNLPVGWTVTFKPATISAGESSDMEIPIPEGAVRKHYRLRVTATGASGASLGYTYNLTVLDTTWSCPRWINRVTDGGFEDGSASPWLASPGVITRSAAQPASTGVYKAWFGQPGTGGGGTLTQTVKLPVTCLQYDAYFDLHIDTAEPNGAPARDRLIVLANNTVLKTYSNVDARGGYLNEHLDLRAFAGSTIQLTFINTQSSRRRTNFVIDDVSVLPSFGG